MPKKSESYIRNQDIFQIQLARIYEATGCSTQADLAKILQIKQSSVSDAKGRGEIPAVWLIKLMYSHKVNPQWIQCGMEPQLFTGLVNTDPADFCPCHTHETLSESILSQILNCFPDKCLVNELYKRSNTNL